MKATGIIVEYNPFHNGHIYHIEKTKEIIKSDVLIAVMSGHFTQRGDASIIDKWQKTEYALKHGVDLVIELPFVNACQSADYFAKGAMYLLDAMNVESICFGSENTNANDLLNLAKNINKDKKEYNDLVKKHLKNNYRYANACNKALEELYNTTINTANDILGLAYVKEIVNNNYAIQPYTIKRTNAFLETDYQKEIKKSNIISATAIREALKENTDVSNSTPIIFNKISFLEQYYIFFKYQILNKTTEELKTFYLVDEGIENLFKKLVLEAKDFNDFINLATSKRYTKTRIQRTMVHIMLETKRNKNLFVPKYIRVLGMNAKGQQYLKNNKEKFKLPVITKFNEINSLLLDIELKATMLYSINDNDLIKKEYQQKIIRI